MKHISSVAFSLCDHRDDADFTPLTPYILHITRQVLATPLPKGICLNVNFPAAPQPSGPHTSPGYLGVRVCRMSPGSWTQELHKCHHPRGYDYYWMVGHYQNDEPEATDTDRWALDHGYVAITPTRIDVTAYEALQAFDFSAL